MVHRTTTIFLWNDSRQEKTVVAATASLDSVEIYYAVENSCSRRGSSCTVSSHTWFGQPRRYVVEEVVGKD